MMKKNVRKVILRGTIISLTAIIPAIAFADNPLNPSAPTIDYQAITKAVENAVANVLIYPMEQFAQVIKYTFDTKPVTSSLTTQSRFPQIPAAEGNAAKSATNINNALDDISSNWSIDKAKVFVDTDSQVCGTGNSPVCYSTTDAQTVLNTDQYGSDLQTKAAQTFLETASGSYIPATPPDPTWNYSLPDPVKYKVFYKTMNAIQSIAQHNLTYSYSIRTTEDDTHPSALSLYNQILTADSKNPSFWQDINRVPVVSQLVTIANYMPAIAVGIEEQNKYLEMINNSLAAMLVQQSILVQSFAGQGLYTNAKMASSPQSGTITPPQPNSPPMPPAPPVPPAPAH